MSGRPAEQTTDVFFLTETNVKTDIYQLIISIQKESFADLDRKLMY